MSTSCDGTRLNPDHVIAGWSAKRGVPATHERRSAVVFIGGRDKPGHDVMFQPTSSGPRAVCLRMIAAADRRGVTKPCPKLSLAVAAAP
jgi:hypothetical protein